ncbi:MAG: diguanylate cyclase domain-containing protein [Nocardioidaceae bacterium]
MDQGGDAVPLRAVGLADLRRLHALIGRVNGCRTLDETLNAVVEGVVEVVGFEVAGVSIVNPDGWFQMVAVAGDEDARKQLLGKRMPPDTFDREFALADTWGALRFVPHERLPESGGQGWVPDIEVLDVPDAWHPQDALFAPLRSPAGTLVGMLSVDLPVDRRRPGPFQRELLEMLAAQAGVAVDNARLTEQLRASEEAFRLAFEGAGTGVAVLAIREPDVGRYLRVNPAFCRIVGYTEDQLLRMRFTDITHPEDKPPELHMLRQRNTGESSVHRSEKRYRHASGAWVWTSVVTSVIYDADGSPQYAISHVEDISARRAARVELAHHANHDVLTGLPNRRVLQARMQSAAHTATTSGREGAVLFIDLDGFKDVNDLHGHVVGDRVLTLVAQRLSAASRESDTVARLGGDEFVLVADDVDHGEIDALAARLRAAVSAPITVDDLQLRVTVSIGMTIIKPYAEDLDGLLRSADDAMYRAKLAGRDAQVFGQT